MHSQQAAAFPTSNWQLLQAISAAGRFMSMRLPANGAAAGQKPAASELPPQLCRDVGKTDRREPHPAARIERFESPTLESMWLRQLR